MRTVEEILVSKPYDKGPYVFSYNRTVSAMEEYANEKCGQLLKDISATFLSKSNQDKAFKESDKDVFQALGETIINFPLPK